MTKQETGRLAFREQGSAWVAYYAKMDTMEDAIELGRINMQAVREFEDIKLAFMDLMKLMFTTILHDATGELAEWPNPPRPAPEHERDKG